MLHDPKWKIIPKLKITKDAPSWYILKWKYWKSCFELSYLDTKHMSNYNIPTLVLIAKLNNGLILSPISPSP
jgi:hypothetical protein